jgi:hypothetical protein
MAVAVSHTAPYNANNLSSIRDTITKASPTLEWFLSVGEEVAGSFQKKKEKQELQASLRRNVAWQIAEDGR